MLMHGLLLDGAERHPDKIAFRWVDRDRTLTYAEAADAMLRLAGGLHELGVRKGDRVSIVAHNGMDYLVTILAAWRLGAVAALVNVRFADELDAYFADHTPTVVVYTHDLAEQVRHGAAASGSVKHLICMDGPQEGAFGLSDLMLSGFPAPPDPADEDAIAHLSYTSGTTGRPKGACLAHEPTVRAACCIGERLRVRADDISFGPTALSSSYQLVANLLPPLAAGCTINVMGRWTAESGWNALEATGATMLVANPTILGEVLQQARQRGARPSRLRFGLSGGGPVPVALKKAWRDELFLPLVESYGQSELGGFVGLGYPEPVPDERLLAVGPPLPDKEVRILGAAANILPIGEIGEICLRGGFMKGYWDRPEATAKALAGGWLHTGDAGFIGRDGAVTMRGRFSELISVAGRTWYPRDVEDALTDQPGVLQAALVALPDSALGHRPVACLTLATDVRFVADEVKSRLVERLPYDLEPLVIRVVESLPMTPTGKIAKAELRDRLAAMA